MKETQCNLILSHLYDPETGARGLSQMEALGLYSIRRLASRITDLKTRGVNIRRELRVDRTGHRYARYFLKGVNDAH